jgi:nitrate/TMAO reductase-like tetraheme cytochrome c subunit
MACHVGPERFAIDRDTGEQMSITIRMTDFHAGDHAKTHCLDCHKEGFDLFPHVRMKTYTCMDCHPRKAAEDPEGAEDDKPYDFERMKKEFEETVHFTEYQHEDEKCCGTAHDKSEAERAKIKPHPVEVKKKEGDEIPKQRFTCEHCHDPHYFKATAHTKLPHLILENDNGPCLQCHKDDATGPLADPAEPNLLAAHAYLPHAELHLKGTRCIDCHTTVFTTVAHDLPEGKGADQGCNSCHSVNTILAERLYRYVNDPERTLGFRNAKILQDNYTMGAHRNFWTDWATYILVGFCTLAILIHGGLRLYYRWWPRWSARKSGVAT